MCKTRRSSRSTTYILGSQSDGSNLVSLGISLDFLDRVDLVLFIIERSDLGLVPVGPRNGGGDRVAHVVAAVSVLLLRVVV